MRIYQAVAKALEGIGVDTVFGGAGENDATLLLALKHSTKIRAIVTRNEQAAAFAERLRKEAPGDLSVQVQRAARLTTGAPMAESKVLRDIDFIKDLQTTGKQSEADALKNNCLLLLNTNGFVYLD